MKILAKYAKNKTAAKAVFGLTGKTIEFFKNGGAMSTWGDMEECHSDRDIKSANCSIVRWNEKRQAVEYLTSAGFTYTFLPKGIEYKGVAINLFQHDYVYGIRYMISRKKLLKAKVASTMWGRVDCATYYYLYMSRKFLIEQSQGLCFCIEGECDCYCNHSIGYGGDPNPLDYHFGK